MAANASDRSVGSNPASPIAEEPPSFGRDDEVGVEIAPNVEVRLARRAIAAQLTEHAPAAATATAEPELEPDGDRSST